MSQVTQQEIIDAATAWWHTRRPTDFTEEQHLLRPIVRVTTEAEKRLCYAVADHLRREEKDHDRVQA